MTSQLYTIELRKPSKRDINRDTLQNQINYVRDRILSSGRGDRKGWTVTTDRIQHSYEWTREEPNAQTFRCKFNIKCSPRVPRGTYDAEFTNIVEIVRNSIKTHKWEIDKVNGETPRERPMANADDFLNSVYVQVDIEQDWQKHFSHLYERDAHINIIHDAIQIAMESEWKHRFHVLLWGPPGCGKSDICISVKEMVGPESVLEFDATATTSAGAIANLNDRDELPRILLVEEIEKADENSLRWLLGLLDIRGNIRKLTYRNKTQRDTKMLCIATVNDVDMFRRMMSGALASRFSHQLYCPRPDRDLLSKILLREIVDIGGNGAWIDPTLDYLKKYNITDPRKAMAICLTGRDRLLTGEFQAQMDKTIEPNVMPLDLKRFASV